MGRRTVSYDEIRQTFSSRLGWKVVSVMVRGKEKKRDYKFQSTVLEDPVQRRHLLHDSFFFR